MKLLTLQQIPLLNYNDYYIYMPISLRNHSVIYRVRVYIHAV